MLARQAKARFAAAIGRLLRPLIRQMIAYGVSYPAFDRMVKQLYLEVAESDFPLSFKRQTDSRLALVTGIGRKDIPALRRQRRTRVEAIEVEDSVITHVVGRWLAGPPYSDADGAPRRLPYESEDANAPSFVRLVRDLGRDTPIRAVLDELLRVGSVELADNRVVLRRQAHVPATADAKLSLLGSDPAELFTTIVHNIEHDETPWLQRKVVYDNVGSEGLEELRREAQRLGEAFLRRANEVVAQHDRDRNPAAPGGTRSRVVIGAYYFEEEGAPAPKDDDHPPVPPGRIRRSS